MTSIPLLQQDLTESVIGAFYEVYNTLGFGFFESVYVAALQRELELRGPAVARELAVRVTYKGQEVAMQRLDMVVAGNVVVEVKSTHDLSKAAPRPVYNYLRAANIDVGLLLHFGPQPKFHRMISTRRGTNPPDPRKQLNPAK